MGNERRGAEDTEVVYKGGRANMYGCKIQSDFLLRDGTPMSASAQQPDPPTARESSERSRVHSRITLGASNVKYICTNTALWIPHTESRIHTGTDTDMRIVAQGARRR